MKITVQHSSYSLNNNEGSIYFHKLTYIMAAFLNIILMRNTKHVLINEIQKKFD